MRSRYAASAVYGNRGVEGRSASGSASQPRGGAGIREGHRELSRLPDRELKERTLREEPCVEPFARARSRKRGDLQKKERRKRSC